jgi:hypothetical protein
MRLGQEVQALLRGNLTPRQRRLPSALTMRMQVAYDMAQARAHADDIIVDEVLAAA